MTESDSEADKILVPLSETQQEMMNYYRDITLSRINGPQLEGLTDEWLAGALNDPATLTIELGDEKVWPLLVKVKHNLDYREQFFLDHFPDETAYYLSLPPTEYLEQIVIMKKLQTIVEEMIARDGIITYDYREGAVDEKMISELLHKGSGYDFVDVTPISEAYGQTYGLPTVVHFEAVARQKDRRSHSVDGDITAAFNQLADDGEYVANLTHGATLLSKEVLVADRTLRDDIWHMYQDQFNELVEDHPSLQIQPREELERMLLDEESFNVGFMEDGKVVGLCYFVSNIEKCVWLNGNFFGKLHAKDPDTKLVYFPGIVVDKTKARKGGEYATSMIGLVEKLIAKAGIDIQIVFQCTNISATYLPQIATAFIQNCASLEFTRPFGSEGNVFEKTAQYNYRVVRPI